MPFFRPLLISILLLLTSTLIGQRYSFGIKANYHHVLLKSEIRLYDNLENYVIYKVTSNKQNIIPSLAPVFQFQFQNAFGQVELVYNYRKTNYTLQNFTLGLDHETELNRTTHSIRLPILSGVNFEFFKLAIGPVIGIDVSENKILEGLDLINEKPLRFRPGASFLVGFIYENVFLDLSYEYQFNGIDERVFHKGQIMGFRSHPHILTAGFGILF